MGGTPVFYGTRVPIQTLLDTIEAGETIDDILEGFPSVSREQVVAFLEEARNRATGHRYALDQLLAECDPRAPRSAEDHVRVTGGSAGREVI